MAKVIVNDALRAKLDLATPTTELCDADGTAIAYVVSADQYRRLVREAMAARHTDERAAQSWADYERNGGVSTREAWEYAERRLSERGGAA
jgi:hypothetical protein